MLSVYAILFATKVSYGDRGSRLHGVNFYKALLLYKTYAPLYFKEPSTNIPEKTFASTPIIKYFNFRH